MGDRHFFKFEGLVVGWERVDDIMGFKHRCLVKPAPTNLSITNDKLRVEQYLCRGGFHQQ